MGMLAKIRRMHIREKLSIREIARRTNLSRDTVRQWLKSAEMSEPKYPERCVVSVVDPYVGQLRSWLETDSHPRCNSCSGTCSSIPAATG